MTSENLERITRRIERLQRCPDPSARLVHLRVVLRLAQDQYDYELHQLESLNVVHADPALTAAHGVPVE